jgi:hypothetical protein
MLINSSNRNASKQSESQPHCMDDCKAHSQIASASATLKPVVQPTCPLMHLNLVTLQHPYVTSCTFPGAVQASPAGDGALPLQPPKRRWRLWPAHRGRLHHVWHRTQVGDAIRTAYSHGQQMASLALIVGRVWARQKATEDSLE